MIFRLKTWQIEAAFVTVVLIVTVFISGGSFRECLGAFAVLFTFMHAQVSDRMAEQQAKLSAPTVDCYRLSSRYYLIKECLWIVYFILSQTWTALAGGVVFFVYPFWRRYYRKKYTRA